MTQWEIARYLIDAKKNIDTLLYIKDNERLLININLREKISNACQQFYINCCIVLDKSFPKDKKKLCENKVIASIYYERDKNSAHKDENYQRPKFGTLDELISILKNQLNTTRNVCKDFLPEVVTLDYVPHDRELFRLVYRVNLQMEEDIYKVKYPQGVFHSYQLSEEGQHFFRSIDITKQDRRTAKMFGYDLDKVLKRQVVDSADDIREMSDEEKQRQAIILNNGLNTYEGLQNRQDMCIAVNLLFNCNMWVRSNIKENEMMEELKNIGFLDQFEIVHWEKVQDKERQEKLRVIMENYK